VSTRTTIARAHRVVVKVGSSSLATADGGISDEHVSNLVQVLAEQHAAGREVVLVSSGAIAAGLAPLRMRRRPRDLANQQAAASVGQGLLLARYQQLFSALGVQVGQVLLTVDDVTRQSHFRNALRTLTRLLEMGVLPIVNENDTVATHEIRFGDNDRLAALVAHLVHADALVLLSDVDSLYTAHPKDPHAERIVEVASLEELEADVSRAGSAVGSGGMRTKLEAAEIATGAGIPMVLAHASDARAALVGEPVGTLFHPTGRKRAARLTWLAHAATTRGDLVLDEGAVRAVVQRKASLLPAGITAVRGHFKAGDPVNLVGPDGRVVARGLVGFDAEELPVLLGRSTHDLAAELGEGYEREVVHRDVLVVLGHRRPRA